MYEKGRELGTAETSVGASRYTQSRHLRLLSCKDYVELRGLMIFSYLKNTQITGAFLMCGVFLKSSHQQKIHIKHRRDTFFYLCSTKYLKYRIHRIIL